MQAHPAPLAHPSARFTASPLFRAAPPVARTPRVRPVLRGASGRLVLQWPGVPATGAVETGRRRL